MFFEEPKVTMAFATFDNWLNDFSIKVERTIADCDLDIPIEIIVMFPLEDYDRILEFGVGHILKIMHYLYVNKHSGHEMSVINLEFLER